MRQLDVEKTRKELDYTKDRLAEAKEQTAYAVTLIKQLEAKIAAMSAVGDELCAAAAFMGWHDKIEAWRKAKEVK
jgi:hypothetical protein